MRHHKFFNKKFSEQNRSEEKNFKISQQRQVFLNELANHPELMWAITTQKGNNAIGYCLLIIIVNIIPVLTNAEPDASNQKTDKKSYLNDKNFSIAEKNLFGSHNTIALGENSNYLHIMEHANIETEDMPRIRKRKLCTFTNLPKTINYGI
jgi:hypothetical protein